MNNRVSEQLTAVDETVLITFRTKPIQYPALIASRSGLHIPYAEQRCQVLADRGLLEQVSDEVAYRVTAAGRDYLDAQTDAN